MQIFLNYGNIQGNHSLFEVDNLIQINLRKNLLESIIFIIIILKLFDIVSAMLQFR